MYSFFAFPSIKWFLIIVELEKATGPAGLVFSVTLGGRPDSICCLALVWQIWKAWINEESRNINKRRGGRV